MVRIQHSHWALLHPDGTQQERHPSPAEAKRTSKSPDVGQQQAAFSRQQDKMAHLREQEKRLGIEIEDDSARIKKSKGKLMAAGNSKEYHAMVREMDSLERINRTR